MKWVQTEGSLGSMPNHENAWDKLLQIKTSGRDDLKADQYHHPYEPTPYSVLERLAASSLVHEDDTVLDYGCGKGRVGFFLSYRTKAKTIGIEYDDRIYAEALLNRNDADSRAKAEFVLTGAETYAVPSISTAMGLLETVPSVPCTALPIRSCRN